MSVQETVTRGPATIYIADEGTALPDRSDMAALKAGTLPGWRSLGDTTQAVVVTETPTLVPLTTQQKARKLRNDVPRFETRIATAVAEHTHDNIVDAFYGVDAGTSVQAGAGGVARTYALALIGAWHANEELLTVAPRVNLVSTPTLTFDADAQSSIPVEFDVLDSGSDAVPDYEVLPPVEEPVS